ncbi:MAG: MBL fold metallo-hydrolase [Flavobacteriaceae bacterium]|nr:MAG: MBL fold metallo-hydrolase [Flavobacteriaceae bacterium]
MKVTFLGTGTSTGIPVIGMEHPVFLSADKKDKRLRVSIKVEWEGACYIVDCGPDFRYQMLRENVQHIDGVLFTHEHADHTAGLDDVRPYAFKLGKLPFYAQKNVLDSLIIRFNYIFNDENKYPGAPYIEQHVVADSPFELKGLIVLPIQVMHGNLPILGYKFGEKFAYVTDAKAIAKEELDKLKNLDVLVINAVRFKPHHSHLSLEEALVIIKYLKPKQAYLTHISHYLGLHEDLQKTLPDNVFVAYDTLGIQIPL